VRGRDNLTTHVHNWGKPPHNRKIVENGHQKLPREQRVHSGTLNRSKYVLKPKNCHYQPYHGVAVAPQPVQVTMRAVFPHKQHDAVLPSSGEPAKD